MESAPPGWTRYVVRSKLGLGRDFIVQDEDERQVFFVDGKAGIPAKADIQDAAGNVVASVRGSMVPIPKRVSIAGAAGEPVAEIRRGHPDAHRPGAAVDGGPVGGTDLSAR